MSQAPRDPLTARTLFVKNLYVPILYLLTDSNWQITGPDLYDLFGKYGPIRQVRIGNSSDLKTKGTAYVVYESPDDAKEAINHLNGFHLMERYIVGEYCEVVRHLSGSLG